ncbi:MAG TPA: histidine kinase [Pseudosphingobacterium sp.]|nr:histidine kinase [Pseudosphingobacterium sp.]
MYKFSEATDRNRKSRKYGAHVALISLFVIYEISILGLLYPKENLLLQLPYYIPAIGLFYIHSLLVMRCWRENIFHRITVVMMTFIEILIYVLVIHFISAIIYKMPFESKEISGFQTTIKAIWKAILILGISCGYWVARRNIYNAQLVKELQLQQAIIERKQVESENAYLRAQINPHFIKNTINYVYGLVENTSKDAGSALLLLAEFIDYSYGESEREISELVPIEEEIREIDCYLSITRLRYREYFSINFENDLPDEVNFKIPPMLLLSFIENMSNHGYINKPHDPAIIKLYMTEGAFHFETSNLSKPKSNKSASKKRIGLSNNRTRLDAYFPDKYTLDITNDGNYFKVKLTVQI